MERTYFFILTLLLVAVGLQAQNKKFRPKRGMKHLSVLTGKADLKVGQKVYYQTTIHGSVGKTVKVSSQNNRIIKLVDTHFHYKNPKKAKMPGGDKGTKTFVFEAIKEGIATITVRNYFRSELQSTHKVTVTVK